MSDKITGPQVYDAKTGLPVSLPDNQVADGIKSGKFSYLKGDRIPVTDQNGDAQTIASEDAPRAFSQGFQPEAVSAQQDRADSHEYGDGIINPALATAAGGLRGVTLGLSDYALTKSGLVEPETLEKLKKYNQAKSTGAEVLGNLAPALLTGGATGVAEGAAEAAPSLMKSILKMTPAGLADSAGSAVTGNLLGKGAVEGAASAASVATSDFSKNLAQRIVQDAGAHAAGGAVQGALYGGGNAISEDALGETQLNSDQLLASIGIGAVIGGFAGGGFHIAGNAASEALKAIPTSPIKSLFSKAAEIFGGVSQEDQKAYMANREAVNSVPNYDEILESASKQVSDIFDNHAEAKISAQDANDSFKAVESSMKAQFKDSGVEASRANQMAKDAMKSASDDLYENLQSKALDDAPQEIVAAAKQHKQNVLDLSDEAGKVLDSSSESIPTKPFFDKIESEKESLLKLGTPEARGRAQKLQDYADGFKEKIEAPEQIGPSSKYALGEPGLKNASLDQYPTSFSPREARDFVKGLRLNSDYSGSPLTFDGELSKNYKQISRTLDQSIKDAVPEYRAAMEKTAPATKLLSQLEDHGFGDVDKTRATINSMRNPEKYKKNIGVLKQLEESTGTSLLHNVEPYVNDSLSGKILESLPQSKKAIQADKLEKYLKSPEALKRLESDVKASPEYAHAQQMNAQLESAISEKESINGNTPSNIQGRINSVLSGRSQYASEVLEKLAKINDKSLPETLQYLRIANVFKKGATNGSRNVNLYGATIGGMAGFLSGDSHDAMFGAGLGAGVGGAVDKYGPQVVKKMLDSFVGLSNINKMNSGVTKTIITNVKSFVSGAGEAVNKAITPASVGYMTRNSLADGKQKGDSKTKAEAYAKRLDELSNSVSNPMAMTDKISRNLEQLSQVAPKIANSMSQTAVIATKYLHDNAPKNPFAQYPMSPAFKKWTPSDADLSRFERHMTAVDNPMSVIKDLKSGFISSDAVSAIKAVYPTLYGQISSVLLDHLTDLKDTLPYEKRMQLSTMFGVPIDKESDPSFVAFMQNVHNTPDQSQNGPGDLVPAGRAGKLNIAQNAQTDTEQTLSRS